MRVQLPVISTANSLRPYYKILTRITYQDTLSGQTQTITASNTPDGTGAVRCDLSNFLQSLLVAKDSSDYTQSCFLDTNLSAAYNIAYAEHWDDGTVNGYTSAYVPVSDSYYVLYAAKQLGERYGGNLAAYVPFPSVTDSTRLARWITDFTEPAYSNGFPFDIGFIYDEALAGLTITGQLNVLDINQKPITWRRADPLPA